MTGVRSRARPEGIEPSSQGYGAQGEIHSRPHEKCDMGLRVSGGLHDAYLTYPR